VLLAPDSDHGLNSETDAEGLWSRKFKNRKGEYIEWKQAPFKNLISIRSNPTKGNEMSLQRSESKSEVRYLRN